METLTLDEEPGLIDLETPVITISLDTDDGSAIENTHEIPKDTEKSASVLQSVGNGFDMLRQQPKMWMVLMDNFKDQLALPSSKELKPIGMMTSDLERPASLSDAVERVSHNQSFFRANYLFLAALFCGYTIFTTPFLFFMTLIAAGFALYTYYWREPYTVTIPVLKKEITSDAVVKIVIGICLFLTAINGSIMTLIWALVVAFCVGLVHAIMKKIPEEDLFGENADLESQQKGINE